MVVGPTCDRSFIKCIVTLNGVGEKTEISVKLAS